MNADEYQVAAQKTALYGNGAKSVAEDADASELVARLSYVALKLNGEAGEVAEHIGKLIRDDEGLLTADRKLKLIKELGDVLWYCAALATELNVNLSGVMGLNLEKLASRQERGKLHGSGSDR